MAATTKPICKYGAKCYRKNPQHWKDYGHPSDEETKEPARKRSKIQDYFQKSKVDTAEGDGDNKVAAAVEVGAPGNTSGYVRQYSDDSDSDCGSPSKQEDSQTSAEGQAADQTPDSPTDVKENIKHKFLVDMPSDFYEFWELAKTVNSKKPEDALESSLGLRLVGPYDVLAGKCKKVNSGGKVPCYLRHWRYYYDPPEFLTVLKGEDSTQFHMGYFRDDPLEDPVFVASNAAKENCIITPRGENIFAAVNWFVEEKLKKEKNESNKSKLKKLQSLLEDWAKKNDISLERKTARMKARDKKVVCKSFHGAGIVVPVDDQEVGYRPVPETPGDLKKMFKKIADSKTDKERTTNFDPLMDIITLVQFANDECDYGEGLELAMDLFCYGGEVFHTTILNLMPLAYQLLGRHAYGDIIKAHLKDRKHSAHLSQLL